MLVPVPPPEEQAAIVDFISWANNKIECAIRAKRKVIALLNEQKKVIIHEAVTRGFKSSVKLKPSGIPRMTDIPEHWDAIALKRVLLRLVDCEHKTAPHVENSNFRVVRTTAIKNGVLQLRGTYFTSESAFRSWTRRGLPEVGDVLFTREAPAGEACVVPSGMNLCLGQRTVLMKVDKEKINSDFLVHMIYGGPPRTAILLASQGSTVSHFNMSDIGSMPILLPPIREQSEIVATLDERTKGINIALQRLESEIHLFLEYRTRLLADVVTGKLKVLDIAKSLPTEWTHERGGNDHSTNSADELELVGEDASI
jgi:type I restriction enzyme S subunit